MQKTTHTSAFFLFGLLSVSAIISGCKYDSNIHKSNINSANPRIEIVLLEGDTDPLPVNDEVIERQWFSPNTWYPEPDHKMINLQLFFTKQGDKYREYLIGANHSSDEIKITWPTSTQDGELISLSFESEVGILWFKGRLGKAESLFYNNEVRSFGTMTVEVNKDEIATIKNAFGEPLSLKDTVSLIVCKADAKRVASYADCKIKIDVSDAIKLAGYDLAASDINKLIENGYHFSAGDVINLARYHVSAEYAYTWKDAGYHLSADNMVYAKQRHLSAEMAMQWKEAGHNLDLEDVYWVKQRHLSPEISKQWKQAGYQLDLKQLYWIKQRHLDPQIASHWKEAGYDVDLNQMYWIKQRHLDPKNAIEWKQAGYDLNFEQLYWAKKRYLSAAVSAEWKKTGYDLSLEDLYKLKRYNVGIEYGKALVNPDYEQFTVDELIKFKQSHISIDTINKLRKRKERP